MACRSWLLAVVLTACLQPTTVVCEDDRTCPDSTVCDVTHHLCVQPGAFEACNGIADGMDCTVPPDLTGKCHNGVCLASICGDGIASEVEQCDGQDLKGKTNCQGVGYYDPEPLGCTPQCTYDTSACTRICGDGKLDMEEDCDGSQLGMVNGVPATCQALGFYDDAPLTCSGLCLWDVSKCTGFCGDGMLNGGELCEGAPPTQTCVDLGYDRGSTSCSAQCVSDVGSCAVMGWHRVPFDQPDKLVAIFGTAADNINAIGWYWSSSSVGGPGWWHFDGTAWAKRAMTLAAPQGQPGGADFVIADAWGAFTGEIVAVAEYWGGAHTQVALHYNGTSWTTRTIATASPLAAVWGKTADDVYAVAGKNVWHWNGANWSIDRTSARELLSVWGVGSVVYAVGRQGQLERYDGSWTAMQAGTEDLHGVWGTSPTDVYAVGDGGTIQHFDGFAWAQHLSPTTNQLLNVWGTSATDIYAVGEFGTIVHYDGAFWLTMTTSNPGAIYDVFGTSPTDLHAVGVGQIVHYGGDGWERPAPAPTAVSSNEIGAVWANSTDEIWVAGADVWKFDGIQWTQTYMPTPLYGFATEMWGSSASDIYVAAGNLQHYNGTWSPG
jgi:hypothetical protein